MTPDSEVVLRGQLQQLPDICLDFPALPQPLIPRDNFLVVIETMFTPERSVVIMEGAEGTGNTTLLAQWALRHPNQSISLFIRPSSTLFYNLDSLRFDLANQIHWILNKKELPLSEKVEQGDLNHLLRRLARDARRHNKKFYFIIDGLADTPNNDLQLRKQILELLPWNTRNFYFLLSGEAEKLPFPTDVKPLSARLTGFSPAEAHAYLGDDISREISDEANKVCQGLPGRLEILRKLFKDEDPRQVLSELSSTLSDVFELSWRQINDYRDFEVPIKDVLALMAHGRRTHTVHELGRIISYDVKDIVSILEKLSFIQIENEKVTFISEAFRRFAEKKLYALRKKAHDLHIQDLLAHPESEGAEIDLPLYYRQAGRSSELLAHLNSETLTKMLRSTGSLATVLSAADAGLSAAQELEADLDFFRLSVQKSALNEFGDAQSWRDEAEARMALCDYESALEIAENAPLYQDKLHLLALIARSKTIRGLTIEPELTNEIERLCQIITPHHNRERAIEIAGDLLPSHPDQAISLVERASSADPGENALNMALAEFSFAAVQKKVRQEQKSEKDSRSEAPLGDIGKGVQDPAVRRFLSMASLFYSYGRFSASQILSEVEVLNDTGAKIFLLRQWCQGNAERDDAYEVVEAALKTVIKAGLYVATMSDLREFSAPLPYISDLEKAKELVGEFDALRVTIELAASEEEIALQLLLAQAEVRYDSELARDRVMSLFLQSCDLEDVTVRAACLSRLLAALDNIDPAQSFETQYGIHSSTKKELEKSFDLLLEATADHFEASRNIVRALSRTLPEYALDFVDRLNTVTRRDSALVEFTDATLRVTQDRLHVNTSHLISAIAKIHDPEMHDYALVESIKRLEAMASQGLTVPLDRLKTLFEKISDITSLESRCIGWSYAWLCIHRYTHTEVQEQKKIIENNLWSACSSIDAKWQKTTVAFRIAGLLGEYNSDLAKRFIGTAESLRRETALETGVCATSYIFCLHLSIRAFSGLLDRNVENDIDLDRLNHAISEVPSTVHQIQLTTEIALRCYLHGKEDLCKKLVKDQINPLINSFSSLKNEYQNEAISHAAPALYCAGSRSALERIESLPITIRDQAYSNICRFLLTKRTPFDPVSAPPRHYFPISEEDAYRICDILMKMDYDCMIYEYLTDVVDSATNNKSEITAPQKYALSGKLESIIRERFPNPRHIKHNGYIIAGLANIYRLRKTVKASDWKELQDDAEALPNLADKAYVLGVIGRCMTGAERQKVFDKTADVIESIPVLLDRADHFYALMSLAEDDKNLREKYAARAIKTLSPIDNSQSRRIQRQVLDYVHRFSPAKASELAASVDSDPARENLKKRVALLDFKNKVANAEIKNEDLKEAQLAHCVNVAWMVLGQLNSARTGHCAKEVLRPYLEVSASGTMEDAYKIMSYVIENTVQRYSDTDQASEFLRPVFEAMMSGTELSAQMAMRQAGIVNRAKPSYLENSMSDQDILVIADGDRDKALTYLAHWIANSANQYLKICDPYLEPSDVSHILSIVKENNPELEVLILTSREGLGPSQHRWDNIRTEFVECWRSDYNQNPPDTRIVIAYTQVSGMTKSPFHDRWWITEDKGLLLGTSFNGLGRSLHNIVQLSSYDASQNELVLDEYLHQTKKFYRDERLRYLVFPYDLD